jgi:hypothetical protein
MTDCGISVAPPQLTALTTTAFTRAAEQAPSLSRDQAPVDVLRQRYGRLLPGSSPATGLACITHLH